MVVTALIMAGGRGERFWPKSRRYLPKQFLSLTGEGKTMLQLTVERILPLIPTEQIFIATGRDYRNLVLEQLPNLPKENILCEPAGKNTAPCIGLGAVHIEKRFGEALMLVLASDHLIRYNECFLESLEEACRIAEKGENLVTIGIRPGYPETGYGYIRFTKRDGNIKAEPEGYPSVKKNVYPVERFVEKPNADLARTYVEAGNYLWNSGMFIWKVSSILNNMKRFLPEMYSGLKTIQKAIGTDCEQEILEREFLNFIPESIDYGIMEKADHIYTIPGDFGWDDVGSWLAVDRMREADATGNVIIGNIIAVDTEHCIFQGEERLIAAVGVRNLVVVDTADIVLICSKDSTQKIKTVLERLREERRDDYL